MSVVILRTMTTDANGLNGQKATGANMPLASRGSSLTTVVVCPFNPMLSVVIGCRVTRPRALAMAVFGSVGYYNGQKRIQRTTANDLGFVRSIRCCPL
jgi:hypothetical protein